MWIFLKSFCTENRFGFAAKTKPFSLKTVLFLHYLSGSLRAGALHTPQEHSLVVKRRTEEYSAHQKGSRGDVYVGCGSREERVAILPGQVDEDVTKKTSELDLRSWSQKFTRWRVGLVGRRQSGCLHRHEQWESTACCCMWLYTEAGVMKGQSMKGPGPVPWKSGLGCRFLAVELAHKYIRSWQVINQPSCHKHFFTVSSSFDCAMGRLRSQFPHQGLNLGHSTESPKS